MRSFEGKVAAITGAGSGIGRALAYELAERRAEVAISDIDAGNLAETAERCRELGVRVSETVVDVADRAAIYAWADAVADTHGRVNLIFNNAGVAVASTLEGVSYENFEWVMNINFWGVVYGSKAFLPHLRRSGDGHIINISSVFGLISVPGNGTYNASKFAVRGFTETLRQELELEGVPVSATCVHPGGIKTNIARSARYDESMSKFMRSEESSKAQFEQNFITSPRDAARTILAGVKRNDRRVLIGPDARVIDWVQRSLPTGYQHFTKLFAKRVGR